MKVWLILPGLLLLASVPVSGQVSVNKQEINDLVQRFRLLAEGKTADAEVLADLAPNYVHITADGQMTTSWRLAGSRQTNPLRVEKLAICVFADVAGASYLLVDNSVPAASRVSAVLQVFQRQQGHWRLISTQMGGRQPIDGPIVATSLAAPVNSSEAENEVRQTFSIYLAAQDLRTPDGGHAEDLDVIRSIWAADSLYVFPDGTATTRDERLAQGHPNTVQLTGAQKAAAVAANSFKHVDDHVALFGDVAVWTSRNPGNLDQSLRVFVKRSTGWQLVIVRHGMSYRTR